MLKVDVHCYWFHVVQRVLLVERKAELALWIKSRDRNVLLDRLWIVLSGPNSDVGVNCHGLRIHRESVVLGDKSIEESLFADAVGILLLLDGLRALVSARTRFSVEVLF